MQWQLMMRECELAKLVHRTPWFKRLSINDIFIMKCQLLIQYHLPFYLTMVLNARSCYSLFSYSYISLLFKTINRFHPFLPKWLFRFLFWLELLIPGNFFFSFLGQLSRTISIVNLCNDFLDTSLFLWLSCCILLVIKQDIPSIQRFFFQLKFISSIYRNVLRNVI